MSTESVPVEKRSYNKSHNDLRNSKTKKEKFLSIILIILIIIVIFAIVYLKMTPQGKEKFTEFYILDPDGKVTNFPTNLTVGEEGKVIIGILNKEYSEALYKCIVLLNGDVIDEKIIKIKHNERWERSFAFKTTKEGEDQKLEFLLYKDKDKEVYRSIYLLIDVRNE